MGGEGGVLGKAGLGAERVEWGRVPLFCQGGEGENTELFLKYRRQNTMTDPQHAHYFEMGIIVRGLIVRIPPNLK